MIAYIQGCTDTSEVNYCPYCGGYANMSNAEGYFWCDDCEKWFAVVEGDETDEETETD